MTLVGSLWGSQVGVHLYLLDPIPRSRHRGCGHDGDDHHGNVPLLVNLLLQLVWTAKTFSKDLAP